MCHETMPKAACRQPAKEESQKIPPMDGGQTLGLRVDTIPWSIRPFYLALTWVAGAVVYLYYALCRVTSRISVEGSGNHDLSQHSIFCIWHENWLSYFVVFLRYRSAHALITHPAAYMKPIHNVFRLMGLDRLLLGSSGEEGKRAINRLAVLVRKGWSTTISPDGPYGPAHKVKKGVLHLALQSGIPIVPLTISVSRYIPVPSWDCKKLPLPFSRIRVIVHEQTHVNGQNFPETISHIVSALGA
jgi:lysophospholipid acyltransferase (LPLAT)-like uncharacterized protein